MKLILGLGNPEPKYEQTRHNAGFLAIDSFLASSVERRASSKKFYSEIFETDINGNKTILAKPLAYMNNSGQAAAEIINFYKIDPAKDLLVIHDDVDLLFGTIRTTESSSAAGHNGVKDIIEKLGTQNFHRIRIGVETRMDKAVPPTDAFVLQKFSSEEMEKLKKEILPNVAKEINNFISAA